MPLGTCALQATIALGIPEERHHLRQLELRLVHPGDIGEGDLDVLLDVDLCAGLADRHQPAQALGATDPAAHPEPDQEEGDDREDPGQQRLQRSTTGNAGDAHALCRELFGQGHIDPGGEEGGFAARKRPSTSPIVSEPTDTSVILSWASNCSNWL